jgi:hypothetical protein
MRMQGSLRSSLAGELEVDDTVCYKPLIGNLSYRIWQVLCSEKAPGPELSKYTLHTLRPFRNSYSVFQNSDLFILHAIRSPKVMTARCKPCSSVSTCQFAGARYRATYPAGIVGAW